MRFFTTKTDDTFFVAQLPATQSCSIVYTFVLVISDPYENFTCHPNDTNVTSGAPTSYK